MAFFDQYSRFLTTSQTGTRTSARLNGRYRAIIEENRELFARKRVLDIASHDGRWSFAALKAGAEHVTGIEARVHLIRNSFENFAAYEIEPSRYDFILGDVFEVMRSRGMYADVVLLLGFLYHTARHDELAELVAATGAAHVIVDTEVIPASDNPRREPLVKLKLEHTEGEATAAHWRSWIASADPSRESINLVFSAHGFRQMKEFDWGPHAGAAEHQDYNEGRRATFLLSR